MCSNTVWGWLCLLLPLQLLLSCSEKNNSAREKLTLKSVIKIPAVKGGFDLMALDEPGKRLFVAAEQNNSIEIIDLEKQSWVKSLDGFDEPKWIVYRPESNRLYITTAGDAKVTVLDGTSYKVLKSFSFKEKCNNLRFDSLTQQLYVGLGITYGSLGVIDVKSDSIIAEIKLPDFPKQFELDHDRIFINIPSKNIVNVVDRRSGTSIADWPVTGGEANVPMALDRNHNRLFVACNTGRLIVFNTATGQAVASLDIAKNADGIYTDPDRSLIYISCGEGFVEIIRQDDADHYTTLPKVITVKGAGTSLFSRTLNLLFLPVAGNDGSSAELRIYKTPAW